MKVSKASKEFATRVFRICTENGALNEEKLSRSISFLGQNRPSDYVGILNELKRLVRLDVNERTVYIESAKELSGAEAYRLQASLVKKHGEGLIFHFATNPDLIGGLRVKIGSQIYDGTVLNKINRLANNL